MTVPTEKVFENSSNIASAKYLANDQVLQVTFTNGKVYNYDEVPAEVWAGMYEAESAGAFVAKSLRGKYKTSRFN